jgi:hypothetical protein
MPPARETAQACTCAHAYIHNSFDPMQLQQPMLCGVHDMYKATKPLKSSNMHT